MRQILAYHVKIVLLSLLLLGELALAMPKYNVLVTGAFRGLGLEIGRELLAQGHRVAFAGRNLEDAPVESKDQRQALAVAMDLANSGSIENGLAEIVNKWGGVDVIIHNAGTMIMEPGQTVERETLQHSSAVNFLGPVHLTQLALPLFKQQKFGRVIYLSSAAAIMREENLAAYAATKSAAETFFRTMARDIRKDQEFSGVDLDISVLRLSFVRGEYNPQISGNKKNIKSSMTKLMTWLRNNSPTSTATVSELIGKTIMNDDAPEFINVGLDGALTSTMAKMPPSVQNACSGFLIGALELTGQLKD